MPYTIVRKHIRGRSIVRSHRRRIRHIPQKLGTTWMGTEGKYIHGPRILSPNLFKYGPYDWSQKYTKKRQKHIINWEIMKKAHLPPSTKLKVGGLKKSQNSKNLAIQSFLTPKKDWRIVSVPPYKRKKSIGKLNY